MYLADITQKFIIVRGEDLFYGGQVALRENKQEFWQQILSVLISLVVVFLMVWFRKFNIICLVGKSGVVYLKFPTWSIPDTNHKELNF